MNRVFLVLFLSLGCNLQAQIDINDALERENTFLREQTSHLIKNGFQLQRLNS